MRRFCLIFCLLWLATLPVLCKEADPILIIGKRVSELGQQIIEVGNLMQQTAKMTIANNHQISKMKTEKEALELKVQMLETKVDGLRGLTSCESDLISVKSRLRDVEKKIENSNFIH